MCHLLHDTCLWHKWLWGLTALVKQKLQNRGEQHLVSSNFMGNWAIQVIRFLFLMLQNASLCFKEPVCAVPFCHQICALSKHCKTGCCWNFLAITMESIVFTEKNLWSGSCKSSVPDSVMSQQQRLLNPQLETASRNRFLHTDFKLCCYSCGWSLQSLSWWNIFLCFYWVLALFCKNKECYISKIFRLQVFQMLIFVYMHDKLLTCFLARR